KVFEEFMRLNISFILLGCGDISYQRFFNQMGKKYRDRVGVKFKFNDSLFHSLVSGSDIMLLPSLVEPCGLTQLYCLKYGTVPVARITGGLADTIRQFNPETGEGTGFLFREANGKHMLRAVKQALKVYENKKFWSRLMKNGMKEDFSWHISAKKYVQLYSKCIQEKK
ncbi:glycosyltransferase, partial [bacterium]|nr:glycosyltransferase [bacterium]